MRPKKDSNPVWRCAICMDYFQGFGNSPWPLADSSKRCCGKCNGSVLDARIKLVR